MIRKMKHPGLEDKTAVVVGTRADDNVHVQEVPKLKVCDAHEHPHVEPRPQGRGARSSLSTSRPWTPPRAVTPSCSPVLAKAERCMGISTRGTAQPH